MAITIIETWIEQNGDFFKQAEQWAPDIDDNNTLVCIERTLVPIAEQELTDLLTAQRVQLVTDADAAQDGADALAADLATLDALGTSLGLDIGQEE